VSSINRLSGIARTPVGVRAREPLTDESGRAEDDREVGLYSFLGHAKPASPRQKRDDSQTA
jgi:hypothetical protein